MINELKDGRFYVSVVCPDDVRRWRICRALGVAQFYEAIFLAGWFDWTPPKSGRKRTCHRLSYPHE